MTDLHWNTMRTVAGNYYHLLVHTPRDNLFPAIINGVYTQYHNFLKKKDGPLFSRLTSVVNIDASSYCLKPVDISTRNWLIALLV